MANIKVLSPFLVNKIAAGEVIERPASVVKELLENAVDSGASKIKVEIFAGGLKKIIVRDNGIGMGRDDLRLSIQRHATSKISEIKDIEKISTMGFRGEALSSIAAVSNLKIDSIYQEEKVGNSIEVENGKIIKEIKSSIPEGTKIIVSNLYYNIPARRKFLKSDRTEFFYIKQIFLDIALAYPKIDFELINNGVYVYKFKNSSDYPKRISDVLGKDVSKKIIKFNQDISLSQLENFKVFGFLGKPEVARQRGVMQKFIVNNRSIKDNFLTYAVKQAYRSFLFGKENPLFIIYVKAPFEKVDVNVHPRKTEVRFDDSRALFSMVYNSVRNSLEEGLKVSFSVRSGGQKGLIPHKNWNLKQVDHKKYEDKVEDLFNNYQAKSKKSFLGKKGDFEKVIFQDRLGNNDASPYELLGQVMSSYILAKTSENILVIDQHAIVERYLFEKIKSKTKMPKEKLRQQGLIVPIALDSQSDELEILKKNINLFIKIGYDISQIGPEQFAIQAVPAVFNARTKHEVEHKKMVNELLGILISAGKDQSELEFINLHRSLQEKIIARMACLGAVKAGDTLSVEEQRQILNLLNSGDLQGNIPAYCPHGRPAVVIMDKQLLEKLFRRI